MWAANYRCPDAAYIDALADVARERGPRWWDEYRIGPVRLAARCGIAASTVHRILVRHHLPTPAVCDRATGAPVRRHESSRAGELVHIDVKKLGRIPDGGGHRVLGRAAGSPNRDRRNGAGYAYLHTALDDHTRLAYTEDLRGEGRHLRGLPATSNCLVRPAGRHR
ncbi:hypothetical protein GCM10010294_27590 [Streptomyces griseoloalbus]|nr:hypothetical protein GCM10010294_27590 [Streptomyces griseoloalbus]